MAVWILKYLNVPLLIFEERVGFEPTERFHALRFSRPVQSTTLAPLHFGWKTGFEPATFGTTNQRSNQLSYIHHVYKQKSSIHFIEPSFVISILYFHIRTITLRYCFQILLDAEATLTIMYLKFSLFCVIIFVIYTIVCSELQKVSKNFQFIF